MSKRVVHCKREPYDVYIGRGRCPNTGRPGKWGNPFSEKLHGRAKCIEMYEDWLDGKINIGQQPPTKEAIRRELKNEVLGCWCSPKACHGDVLARIANGE